MYFLIWILNFFLNEKIKYIVTYLLFFQILVVVEINVHINVYESTRVDEDQFLKFLINTHMIKCCQNVTFGTFTKTNGYYDFRTTFYLKMETIFFYKSLYR